MIQGGVNQNLSSSSIPVPMKLVGIVGQDPSDSNSNRLHVDIFQFRFHSFKVYSIGSSKVIGNSIGYSSKLRRSFVTNRRFFPNNDYYILCMPPLLQSTILVHAKHHSILV